MEELLSPKVDFVFKRIFGSEENKDILLSFLNATLKLPENNQLQEIKILNSYIDKDALSDKQSILDVRAQTSTGIQINIEIQLHNQYDIEKRTLYYWAKMYEEQLEEGQPYKHLRKTITINILDFDYLPNDHYHNVFHLREDTTNQILTDDIEIHFLELRKLDNKPFSLHDRLIRWMVFIKGVNKEQLEELAMDEPALQKAMNTLEFLSQDKEMRRLYELRQKAIRDEISMIIGAKEEGREEGRKEGREEGRKEGREEGRKEGREEGEFNAKIEIAKSLIKMEMEIEKIHEVTGLSIDELRKIKEQLQ